MDFSNNRTSFDLIYYCNFPCHVVFYALSENRNPNFKKLTIKKLWPFRLIYFLSIIGETINDFLKYFLVNQDDHNI